ncbi:MAG: metalloregulator ArsR/SmtB family transcription factor [Thermaerobacter sp.]|nr:metalloregulator ArsR/SmtB family transcription factor [Thermaerobacter sp.]
MRDDHRAWKDEVYGHVARMGKAMASPRRLEILDLLAQGPKSVEQLAGELLASVANTSQHLHQLKGARLVRSHKAGTYVIYELAGPAVNRLLESVEVAGESLLLELGVARQQYFPDPADADPVPLGELQSLMASDALYLIDVRPVAEYAAQHLPGAVSVPLPMLAEHFRGWQGQKPVVAYCRGRYCLYARDAVRYLAQQGIAARRTEASVRDWPPRPQAIG